MKNMKRSAFALSVLIALLCAGCDIRYQSDVVPNAQYKCDSAQLEMVKKQVEVCKDMNYLSSYCWDTARAEQCTVIKQGT